MAKVNNEEPQRWCLGFGMKDLKITKPEWVDVMDDMWSLAETIGKDVPQSAWLDIGGVFWPNPHYTGEPVAHPECNTEFHPQKKPTQRKRFLKQRKRNKF